MSLSDAKIPLEQMRAFHEDRQVVGTGRDPIEKFHK
jgi:hypothetical protein